MQVCIILRPIEKHLLIIGFEVNSIFIQSIENTWAVAWSFSLIWEILWRGTSPLFSFCSQVEQRDNWPRFSTAESGRAGKGRQRLFRIFPSYCSLPFTEKQYPASLACGTIAMGGKDRSNFRAGSLKNRSIPAAQGGWDYPVHDLCETRCIWEARSGFCLCNAGAWDSHGSLI